MGESRLLIMIGGMAELTQVALLGFPWEMVSSFTRGFRFSRAKTAIGFWHPEFDLGGVGILGQIKVMAGSLNCSKQGPSAS